MTRMEEAIERAAFRRFVKEISWIGYRGPSLIAAWHEVPEEQREIFRSMAVDTGVVDRWTDERGIHHYDFAQANPFTTSHSVWSTHPLEYLDEIAGLLQRSEPS